MSHRDSDQMSRARRARDKLLVRFEHHPDVSLIDIGYAPQTGQETEQIALRIHVRKRWMEAKPEERTHFPQQVDGFRVVVTLGGDYRPAAE
jgi:hypothetical protein